MFSRRLLLASLTASALAASMVAPAHAADKVIKVGTLKLIHGITPYFYDRFAPAGYKIEVVTFDTPTDGKNAVVTKSVDFGTYGLAAATLGAAAGEPVVIIAPQSNGGMAIVVHKDAGVGNFKALKGKRVGILPGSTQEAVFLDRLKAEGMTIKDVKSVRVSFSEMAGALERGDIDAYVGAEPGPSISVIKGVGKVLELPYSTPTGSVNMVMTTHADTVKNNAELTKAFLEMHRKAAEYATANRPALIEMAGAKLGLPADVANLAADNVQLTWKIDADWVQRGKYYGSLMLERKQIRKLPDYSRFIVTGLVPQS
ncbi:ABC transporter substrate-binding protein [Comamonas endophytica]|uniref:NrtA/SsuA/CpmA family ABC transporter substrate-binding protein n=1 Tax=Comamonas endophytica TaxID=2949090 RepID=A0ABY6G5U9_9BURK|nr:MULTISPECIES: NrtA/SsuA/CpmA family ABC transporter substrate-binding protein [unclassified Acidovorax]MCD2512408.1 NrtA/SsuA/CpmA family ABC transporter substrate-binding protein [Acidovorax sp. D4N7]UYG50145.1 NrtA/SsuA/CpmA family ABC transporter substrate-binding protein [Acidovorax sp. 5MLIR]